MKFTLELKGEARWCDLIEALQASAHFLKRDCVAEATVYKEIEGKWGSEVRNARTGEPLAAWRLE